MDTEESELIKNNGKKRKNKHHVTLGPVITKNRNDIKAIDGLL
jgi:hypothetical protein